MPLFSSRRRGGRVIRRSLIHTLGALGLVVLLGASGAGVTYALWSANTSTSSTVTGAKLGVTTTFAPGLAGFEFQNHSLTATGSFTVENTTSTTRTTPMPVTATVTTPVTGAGTNAEWSSRFSVAVWPRGASCDVTTPQNATSTITTSLAPKQSATYCLRITGSDRSLLGVPGGSLAVTPTVTTTLSFNGASEWSATAGPSIRQATKNIYPAATLSTSNWFRIDASNANVCLDVSESIDAENRQLIGFPCKANSEAGKTNQRWRLVADGSYYRIVTQLPSSRSITGIAATAGSGIRMQETVGELGLWQAQQISTGIYQLVNKSTGFCLARGAVANTITTMSQQACAASDAQKFRFTADGTYVNPIADPTVTLGCRTSGANAIISWGAELQSGTTYRVYRNTSDTLSGATDLGSVSSGTGVTVQPGTLTNGTYYILITDGTHTKSLAVVKDSLWFFGTYHYMGCAS